MIKNLPKVELYSDGGARPNPGPGAYGIILRSMGKESEFSGFDKYTTNNRMELTGVIVGLLKLNEKCFVNVYTDSSYIVNAINKGWLKKWEKSGWKTISKRDVENKDLWELLSSLLLKHDVNFNWVKGHSGHKENERCDEIATNQILKNTLMREDKQLKTSSPAPLLRGEGIDSKKIKIKKPGDNCRKCNTPVIKMQPKNKNIKNKSYYYSYYLSCPNCKTNYFIDEAKVMINTLDI